MSESGRIIRGNGGSPTAIARATATPLKSVNKGAFTRAVNKAAEQTEA